MDKDEKKKSWNEMLSGLISTKRLYELTGQKAYRRGIGRLYSKYRPKDLREMHARGVRVKNPKVGAQIAAMHQAWADKKGLSSAVV